MIVKQLRLLASLVAIASFGFLFSCGGGDDGGGTPAAAPDALFNLPSSATTGQTVSITNQSINSSSYTWDFGDGSAVQNTNVVAAPSHFYSAAGTYEVTLTAYADANQQGASATFARSITVTKGNPVVNISPRVFSKVSDDSPVYPVAANMLIDNNSSEANSFTVDWGDNTTENYESPDDNFTHEYTSAGNYTITITGFELPGQAGDSDEFTYEVEVQNYNRLRVTKFTLYPAINDSLGTQWDDGDDNDIDNDNTEADLMFTVYNFDENDSTVTTLVPLISTDELRDVQTITEPIDVDVAIALTNGGVQDFINVFAPQEPWDLSLHAVIRSNRLIFNYTNSFPVILLMEFDEDDAGNGTVFDIFDIDEIELTGATGSSIILNNDNGDPIFEIHYTLEEQTGQ